MSRQGSAADNWDSAETTIRDEPLREAEHLARQGRVAFREHNLPEATRCARLSLAVALRVAGTNERRADVLLLVARVLRDLDDLERCETAARAALAAEARCERPIVLGRITLFLAHVLHDRGNYDEAAAAGHWAYLCYERAKGKGHPETRLVGELLERLTRPSRRSARSRGRSDG